MLIKAGDTVCFVRNPALLSCFTLGKTYVVKSVGPNALFVQDDNGWPNYFHLDEVELVERKSKRNLPSWW